MDISFADILNLGELLETNTESLNENESFIKLIARISVTRIAYRVYRQDDGLTPVVIYNSPLSKGEPISYVKKIGEYDSIMLRIYHSEGYVYPDESAKSATDLIANIILNSLCINYVGNLQGKAYIEDNSSIANTTSFMSTLGKLIATKKQVEYFVGFLNLKSVHTLNALFGENITDKFIKEYGKMLNSKCDTSLWETVALFGGDNFAFLVHEKNIASILEFIKSVPITINNKEDVIKYDLTCRVGVARCAYDISTPSEAVSAANMAYKKTRAPRAKDIYFTNSSDSFLQESDDSFAGAFKRDLDSGKLLVYYQPIINIERNTIVAAEALVRWRKDGEMIKPSDFIPMAENLNLITEIDLFVLKKTCENIRKWIDDGHKVVPISFNFSHYDLLGGNLSEQILSIVDSYDIDHRYIVVEFSEAGYREELEALLYTTKILRDNGIGVTIDNYGMGYSSFTLLQNIDIDFIKFNSSLIRESNDKMKILLAGLIDTTSKLGINIVTQGVMDENIINTFRSIGCNYFQSEYFEKALSERFFINRLNQ